MTIKSKKVRSRRERKAFIVAHADRFLPKMPVPIIRAPSVRARSMDNEWIPDDRQVTCRPDSPAEPWAAGVSSAITKGTA